MSFWREVKQAATTGIGKAAAAADITVRKLDLQRKIAGQRLAQDRTFAAIGRALAAQVKDGRLPPEGTQSLFEDLKRIEDEIAGLEEELSGLQGPITGQADLCPNCGAVISANQRFCASCGQNLDGPR